jgi:hypothetical protein
MFRQQRPLPADEAMSSVPPPRTILAKLVRFQKAVRSLLSGRFHRPELIEGTNGGAVKITADFRSY